MNEGTEQNNVDERIISFLSSNTNLTIATCVDKIPYCANCFFAYDQKKNLLIFKSSKETNHVRQALLNPNVAGSVTPDKLEKGKIRGVQFQGNFIEPQNEILELAKNVYYKKYPFALVIPGNLWVVEINNIKMTDNTLGFGKKIEWKKKLYERI